MAEDFELKAFEVKTPAELDEAMVEAFASRAPVFLDVITGPKVKHLPPVYTWLQADGDEKP